MTTSLRRKAPRSSGPRPGLGSDDEPEERGFESARQMHGGGADAASPSALEVSDIRTSRFALPTPTADTCAFYVPPQGDGREFAHPRERAQTERGRTACSRVIVSGECQKTNDSSSSHVTQTL